jgi:hypothetical protein
MRREKINTQPFCTVILVFLLVLSLLCSGCHGGQVTTAKNISPTPKSSSTSLATDNTVKSSDGSMMITAPADWKADNELWAGSDISLSGWDYHVVVLKKPKTNDTAGESAADFLIAANSDFTEMLYNINWKPSSSITIGGLNGIIAQMNAKSLANRAALTYLVSVVVDNDNFYEIIGWTSSDRVDLDLTYLKSAMAGFHVN